MNAPEGYSNPPEWLAELIDPIYAEFKALIERAHDLAVTEAQRRGEDEPAKIGIMTIIGLSVQSNMLLVAKGIAAKPMSDPGRIVTSLSLDVHNSAVITFEMLCQTLVDAQGATRQ